MVALKPAYLIHGDDHGAVAERRAGLRALAEAAGGGSAAIEVLEGDAATPAAVAAALATMTLGIGGEQPSGVGRVIIVEGVERWRQADVERHLAPAMADMPPETTLALFAREESRARAPAAVHDAVRGAGGQVVARMTVKPWELGKWVREQAAPLGLSLDAAAAKTLVAQVGERQQRLLRELEKLALEADVENVGAPVSGPREVSAQEIEERAAHSAELRGYRLADALVAGDGRAAAELYLGLRAQGERLSGLTYAMAQRLRDAVDVSQRLRAGEPVAEVKRSLQMPSRAAERFVADVASSDPDRLVAALGVLADLELDSRGGSPLPTGRSREERRGSWALEEDTIAVRAIEAISR